MGPLFTSSLEVQGTFQATKPHWGEVFNTAHDIQLRTAHTDLRPIVRNPCLRVATSPLLLEGEERECRQTLEGEELR